MFILSAVRSSRGDIEPCPNKLAIVHSITNYTLVESGITIVYVDVIYLIDNVKYYNRTSPFLVNLYQLEKIKTMNGLIRVYTDCIGKLYYLGYIANYAANGWLRAALIFGSLSVIGTILVAGYCGMLASYYNS